MGTVDGFDGGNGSGADRSFGGDHDWAVISAKFAQYIALTKSNKHLLCYRGEFTHSWGGPPFNQVPGLS